MAVRCPASTDANTSWDRSAVFAAALFTFAVLPVLAFAAGAFAAGAFTADAFVVRVVRVVAGFVLFAAVTGMVVLLDGAHSQRQPVPRAGDRPESFVPRSPVRP
jgi:zinc transporter ZupT